MQEAKKNEYFIDGFLIRHFNIYPVGFDKNNLLEAQRNFLVYLIGFIPNLDDWNLQVTYLDKLNDIKQITKIEIAQEDIDLAKMQNRDIEELKKERLKEEKEKKIIELKTKYGIKIEKQEEQGIADEIPEIENVPKNLWDILQGKGIIKKEHGL